MKEQNKNTTLFLSSIDLKLKFDRAKIKLINITVNTTYSLIKHRPFVLHIWQNSKFQHQVKAIGHFFQFNNCNLKMSLVMSKIKK